MNTSARRRYRPRHCAALLAGALLMLMGARAHAAVTMQGNVSLDYYVADTDADGFERTQSEIQVDTIANSGSGASGPLSLSGWLTADPSAAGAGTEVGNAPIGVLSGNSSLQQVDCIVDANDAAPGEYFPHVLLQDDSAPGTYDDARDLTPHVLWRGGLEAVGPLHITPFADGSRVSVDFAQLRNNRIDSRYTNPIVLTLYVTFGKGPASDGYTLCSTTVPGLYAGDTQPAPGFDCAIASVPDGDYTAHVSVAESGGRGGESTLSGPDLSIRTGRMDTNFQFDFNGGGYGYYVTGATTPATLAVLLCLGALRVSRRRLATSRA